VPVSIIEKIDESKKYGPETSNEKGMASLSLEAPEGSVLLVYYGDSATNYPEDQPDTVTIQPGETRYSLEKQLRRKMEISVIAFTQATAESQRQPNPGVSVSVGGTKLGLTDNSGQWKGPSGTIPTRQNVDVDPEPKSMKIDKVAAGYSIVLEYAPKVKPPKETTTTPKPPPPVYISAVDESKNPITGVEVWMYGGTGDENNQMSFESESQKINLALLGSTADSEGRLELPEAAEDHQFHLSHPDYWPVVVSWQQTKQPIQMISIKQERSFGDFGKAQIDGAESYYQLAQRYHNRGLRKDAIKGYQNAIRLVPRLKHYLQLGWAYQEMDQAEAALKQVNIGLELKLLDDPEADEQLLKQQLQELLGLLQ
jgi:tetratricopeptide (TPR) repeat protein